MVIYFGCDLLESLASLQAEHDISEYAAPGVLSVDEEEDQWDMIGRTIGQSNFLHRQVLC